MCKGRWAYDVDWLLLLLWDVGVCWLWLRCRDVSVCRSLLLCDYFVEEVDDVFAFLC